jgi:putative hydrolase of HD superfamily
LYIIQLMMLDFFKIAANLKNVSRQGWVDKLSISDPESVADHSYSMAMMCMVISDLENYDSEKVLKMAILHDLAESKTGDFTPDQITKEKKKELENGAFSEIMAHLPDEIKSQYLEIWSEYQENVSPESKIVHQIDRLEMALQARLYQKDGHPEEKLNQFFKSAGDDIIHPKLKALFTQLVNDK